VQKAEIFQQFCKDIGIEMIIDMQDRAVWSDNWNIQPYGKHELTQDGRSTGSLHPAAHANMFHSKTGRNVHKHYIEELDRLIEEGQSIVDEAEAKEHWKEYQRVWMQSAIAVPIYNPYYTQVWHPIVKGEAYQDAKDNVRDAHLIYIDPAARR